MSSIRVTTNFRDNFGTDLGTKLITKDYLMSVYPGIAQEIGKTPELWTWGMGNAGGLGNAQITNTSTPITTFAGGTNWRQVSTDTAGNARITAAIKTDGTLWTWGYAQTGKLGNATASNTIVSTPVTTFAGGTNWKQINASESGCVAIKTDGTLWTWGQSYAGRLGNNNTTTGIISTPITTFAGGTNWRQVSSGGYHVAAIKTDGTLWIWGQGSAGKLGNAQVANILTPVTTFAGGNNWKQVSAGNGHTVAIKTDGTLWTWGQGSNGALGNGTTIFTTSTPVTTFAGGTNWKQVDGGLDGTSAIKTDGTLWTWGSGTDGQLGNAQTTNSSTPVTTFAGGTNWKQVSRGRQHTTAIKTDGTLWTWGLGSFGRLGNGLTTGRTSTPVTTFAGGTNWKQVDANGSATAAIRSTDFI